MSLLANQLPEQYNGLLAWVLLPLAQQWAERLRGVLKLLRRQLTGELHEGIYEVLEYDFTLSLKDAQGKRAVFERRERVRFLQDNVIAYEDQAWGDGEVFAHYECSPGVPVDRYRDGHKWKVLISLREEKQRGNVVEFHIRREVRDQFVSPDGWLQVEVSHRTRHLRVSVVFPKERLCRRAVLVERNRGKTTTLGPSYFGELPDGRQAVSFERSSPSLHELYTLRWQW